MRNIVFLRHSIFIWKCYTKRLFCTQHDRLLTLESDVIDDFTTQLMQRKLGKWETKRAKGCLNDNLKPIKQLNYKPLPSTFNLQSINNRLHEALEVENKDCIKNTIEWCFKNQQVPELTILLQVFSFYSYSGDKAVIIELIDLCKNLDEKILKQYSHFNHYLAEVTWVKGNINEAIKIFEELYINNLFLRRRIKNMLKHLLTNTISNRSEAVLICIIDFAKRLAENYKDFYILACAWKCCILSEWFTDQCMALDLFEQNEGLRKAVMKDLLYITIIALKSHQTEVVYKILEILIKFDNKPCYKHILEALFEYKVCQRDVRGCAEIARWALDQGIELPTFQQEKLVALLLAQSSHTNIDVKIKPKPIKPPDYNFKF